MWHLQFFLVLFFLLAVSWVCWTSHSMEMDPHSSPMKEEDQEEEGKEGETDGMSGRAAEPDIKFIYMRNFRYSFFFF